MQRDLTQQYAHYHQKWEKEQQFIALAEYKITENNPNFSKPWWTRELALAKRRAQYANNKMCALEVLSQAQGNPIGALTLQHAFPAVQDGYIIPATPTMYQDD